MAVGIPKRIIAVNRNRFFVTDGIIAVQKHKKFVFHRPIRIFEYLDAIDAPTKMYERMGRLVMLDLTEEEKDARRLSKLEKDFWEDK